MHAILDKSEPKKACYLPIPHTLHTRPVEHACAFYKFYETSVTCSRARANISFTASSSVVTGIPLSIEHLV